MACAVSYALNNRYVSADFSVSPGSGANRTRTDDPLLAKQVLYQLSYRPITSFPFYICGTPKRLSWYRHIDLGSFILPPNPAA
jgi:hypothetical protein